MSEEVEIVAPEVVSGSALATIEKASIDVQIQTARAFPRSMDTFKKRATEMACMDEETAESCIYKRPVGRDEQEGGKQKVAEGMSVRMAEIVGASYGNLRVGSIIVEQTPRYVKARGIAHDLESNFLATCEVVEVTVTRQGIPYSERQRGVVAQVALAKARRNATFMVVPKALAKPIIEEAKRVAIGTAETLNKRREKVMAWIKSQGIDPKRVFAVLEVEGEADIGLEHMETLTGLRTAIRDGDTTLEQAFPLLDNGGAAPSTGSKSGDLAAKLKREEPKSEPTPPPQTQETESEPQANDNEVVGILEKVVCSTKPKDKPGKDWTKWELHVNGEKYSTFDKTLGYDAAELEGAEVVLTWEFDNKSGKYKNAVGIRAAKAVDTKGNTDAEPREEELPMN